MKTVGIIIAKENSNRFKGKNYYIHNSKPLFFHSVELMKNSGIKDIYVCTDSRKIIDFCAFNNIEFIYRGENVIRDEEPYFNVLKFAYQSINKKYDCVVSVLANSINHDETSIKNGLEIMENDKQVNEIRSFDENGNQSGIFIFRYCLFDNFHTLAHMGIIKSNGKEIHYKDELK